MPISATGNKRPDGRRRPSHEAGFSLVELLAVLAIISLMAGAVVLGWPSSEKPFDRDTRSVQQHMLSFIDQGITQGTVRAFGPTINGLTLFEHDGLRWVESDRLDWPDDTRIQLWVGERRQTLAEEAEPLFLVEPMGVSDPFRITISGRDNDYWLRMGDNGALTLQDANEAPR